MILVKIPTVSMPGLSVIDKEAPDDDGGNLYHLIKARKGCALAGRLVSSIFCQIISGLNHIHSSGYFHREGQSKGQEGCPGWFKQWRNLVYTVYCLFLKILMSLICGVLTVYHHLSVWPKVWCHRWQVQCDPKSPTVTPMLHPSCGNQYFHWKYCKDTWKTCLLLFSKRLAKLPFWETCKDCVRKAFLSWFIQYSMYHYKI